MIDMKVKGRGVLIHVMNTYGQWEFSSVYSKPWPYTDVGRAIHALFTLLRRKVTGYTSD